MSGRNVKRLAGAVFAYEAVALASNRTWPTLTRLSARYPWLKYVLTTALILHFWPPYILDGAKPEKAFEESLRDADLLTSGLWGSEKGRQ